MLTQKQRMVVYMATLMNEIMVNAMLDNQTFYEGLGTLASLLIVGSFLFNDEKSIRLVNLLGASLFGAYGLLIGAIPVAATNLTLAVIQLYKLSKMKSIS